jgi:hypothetical protein
VRYLLIIRDAVAADGTEPDGCGGWSEEMRRRGVLAEGPDLRLDAQGVTVRVREGERLVVDGPFAETKEQVGGLAVIECADLAEAAEVAARHPVAARGSVEIRPLRPA